MLALVPLLLLLPPLAPQSCDGTRLQAVQPAPLDLFGSAVDVEGDVAAVGAWLRDVADPLDGACNSGAVFLFERRGPGWSPAGVLAPEGPVCREYFGQDLDLDPGRLVVGATGFLRGEDEVGAAFVFERSSAGWVQAARLLAPDGADGDGFGASVAARGDWIAVGAPAADFPGAPGCGAAYLFRRGTGGWAYHSKHTAPVPDPGMGFGGALALSSSPAHAGRLRLAVGASGDPERGIDAGAVYLLVEEAGAFAHEAKVTAQDARWGDLLGVAVALEGDRLMAGATGRDGGGQAQRGAVYGWRYAGGTWVADPRLDAPDPVAGARFGGALALRAGRALVGAGFDPELGPLSGAAYLFDDGPAGPRLVSRLRPPGLAAGDFLGSSLALGEDVALLGLRGSDLAGPEAGLVRVLELPPEGVLTACTCAPLSACGNFEPVDGCTGSTGLGASLDLLGSASVSASDLQACAARLPVAAPAWLVVGRAGEAVPFGDGVLCVGTPAWRRGPVVADLSGRVSVAVPTAGLAPGQHVLVQVFYRDPAGPCGTGWNTTRGLSIELRP